MRESWEKWLLKSGEKWQKVGKIGKKWGKVVWLTFGKSGEKLEKVVKSGKKWVKVAKSGEK